MALVTDIVQQSMPATAINQTFTADLGGLTPTAAKFIFLGTTATGAAQAHLRLCMGITDGTNSFCQFIRATDAVSASVARRGQQDNVIAMINPTSTTIEIRADFVSFSANAVTIDWTAVTGTQYEVICILYAGVSAKVDVIFPNITQNSGTTFSGLGFTPRYVQMWSNGVQKVSSASNSKFMYGSACLIGGSIKQMSMYYGNNNNQTTTEVGGQLRDDRVGGEVNNAGIKSYGIECTDISSGEFTITTRDGGGGPNDSNIFLALGTDENSVNILEFTGPNSTGNHDYTGIGFEPNHCEMMGSEYSALNTQFNAGEAGSMFFNYMVEDSNDSFGCYLLSQDNVGTTREKTSLRTAEHLQDDQSGARIYTSSGAQVFSFDKVTINYTAVPSTALKYMAVCFGIPLVGVERSYPRGVNRGITRGVI